MGGGLRRVGLFGLKLANYIRGGGWWVAGAVKMVGWGGVGCVGCVGWVGWVGRKYRVGKGGWILALPIQERVSLRQGERRGEVFGISVLRVVYCSEGGGCDGWTGAVGRFLWS